MSREGALIGLGALALAGVVGWHLMHFKPPADVGIGIDPSASVERKCGDLRGAVKAFIDKQPGIREGSTLTVLIMGTDASNAGPKLAWRDPLPVAPDTVFGVDKKKQAEKEAAFYSRIEEACQTAKAGGGSPIYELVQQGIAHLRAPASGCGPESRCYYLVKTDLDEDVQPALRSLMQRAAKSGDVEVPAGLARSINNDGIQVTFCGVSEVAPRRTSGAARETRQRIFTELFTSPELVSFQPFCK
jgi:hypothetical protein